MSDGIDGDGVHDLVGWLRNRHIDKFGAADQMSSIFALAADEVMRLQFELRDMDARLTDDLCRLMGERNAARARAEKAEALIATARHTADHWRRWALDNEQTEAVAAHALCMVLTALDGVTDLEQLGIGDDPPDDIPAWGNHDMSDDVAVVRNGTRYEVWIGLRLLSTHATIAAARTSARQIVEAERRP